MYPKVDSNKQYPKAYPEPDKQAYSDSYDKNETAKYDDNNKYNNEYPKVDSNKQYPKAYPEPDKKAYADSYDVKSPKKIKIIDCNNLNVNADELKDLEQVSPSIQKAIASDDAEESQYGTYNEYSENSPNTGVYYIQPDTKVIFKCNNENHNLINQTTSVVSDTDTSTTTDTQTTTNPRTITDVLGAVAQSNIGANNLAESLGTTSQSNSAESLGTTSQSNSAESLGTTSQSENTITTPSVPPNGLFTDESSLKPFVLPIPNYLQ